MRSRLGVSGQLDSMQAGAANLLMLPTEDATIPLLPQFEGTPRLSSGMSTDSVQSHPLSTRLSVLSATLRTWQAHRLMLSAARELAPLAQRNWEVHRKRHAFGLWARCTMALNAWLRSQVVRWARQQAWGFVRWVEQVTSLKGAQGALMLALRTHVMRAMSSAVATWRREAETRRPLTVWAILWRAINDYWRRRQ